MWVSWLAMTIEQRWSVVYGCVFSSALKLVLPRSAGVQQCGVQHLDATDAPAMLSRYQGKSAWCAVLLYFAEVRAVREPMELTLTERLVLNGHGRFGSLDITCQYM